jgi:hypothetical protein
VGANSTENGLFLASVTMPLFQQIDALTGLNDISVLSKSNYVRSLSRDEAVIWRMSAKLIRCAISKSTYVEPGCN